MKNHLQIQAFLNSFPSFRNKNLSGRYLNYPMLKSAVDSLPSFFRIIEEGVSTSGTPIISINFGNGPEKVLGWSQMHGNESTTTKALFDLFNYLHLNKELPEVSGIIEACTFKIIPMLNPDGADLYTRENANGVDLNRDAVLLTQKESQVLRSVFKDYNPGYCFNLHDQRTIFGAGNEGKPATLSFLAPSHDDDRNISPSRRRAMKIIGGVFKDLQKYLPGQLGRFDDAFNVNCTGDRFMTYNVPTILFEAGHYPGDYQREETRKYMAAAILAAIKRVMRRGDEDYAIRDYFKIPENQKNFFDIILRNVSFDAEEQDIAIQYQEKLVDGKLIFEPGVQLIDRNIDFFGHRVIDCKGREIAFQNENTLVENDVVTGILLNRDNISLKIE